MMKGLHMLRDVDPGPEKDFSKRETSFMWEANPILR